MEKVTQDLREAATQALSAQDASNFCGVVQAFARAMKTVNQDCINKGLGTDGVRKHPITILFMDKLNSMTGGNAKLPDYIEATKKCEEMVS